MAWCTLGVSVLIGCLDRRTFEVNIIKVKQSPLHPFTHENYSRNFQALNFYILVLRTLIKGTFLAPGGAKVYLLLAAKRTVPDKVCPSLTKSGVWSKHLTWYQRVRGSVGAVESHTVDLQIWTGEGLKLFVPFAIKNMERVKFLYFLLGSWIGHIKPESQAMDQTRLHKSKHKGNLYSGREMIRNLVYIEHAHKNIYIIWTYFYLLVVKYISSFCVANNCSGNCLCLY